MSDSAKKMAWEIIGITMMLLVIGFYIAGINIFAPVVDNVKTTAQQKTSAMLSLKYVAYENNRVSGSNVKGAIKKYTDKDYFNIYLNYGSYTTIVNPSGFSSTAPKINFSTGVVEKSFVNVSGSLALLDNEASSLYVSPQSSWDSKILKDDNDQVVGILFIKIN
jgi:hypothetical protein